MMAAFLDLVVVVHEADDTETRHNQKAGPDIQVVKVHPKQHRHRNGDKDHQSAHRRRTDLGKVRLRPVAADGLAFALPHTEHSDEFRTDQQADDKRGRDCRSRPETKIAQQIENTRKSKIFCQYI
jgi:hypothetical protein